MTHLLRFSRLLLPLIGSLAGFSLQLRGGGDVAALLLSTLAGAALGTFLQLFLSSMAALLGETPLAESASASARVLAQLERDKRVLLRSIKELEFDAKLGRIDAEEAVTLSAPLKERATRLLKAIDQARVASPDNVQDEIERALAAKLEAPQEPPASPPQEEPS